MPIQRVLIWIMSYLGGWLLVYGVAQELAVPAAIGASLIVGGSWVYWVHRR